MGTVQDVSLVEEGQFVNAEEFTKYARDFLAHQYTEPVGNGSGKQANGVEIKRCWLQQQSKRRWWEWSRRISRRRGRSEKYTACPSRPWTPTRNQAERTRRWRLEWIVKVHELWKNSRSHVQSNLVYRYGFVFYIPRNEWIVARLVI